MPADGDLAALAAAAARCQGCELYRDATQTVFGHGDEHARFVLIGEQPGDQEDKRGLPFVGPAGALLNRALAEAGIDPDQTYVTNAVKHFRWKSPPDRGKRRMHEKPGTTHINACRPWLLAGLSRLRPAIIVLLGATAGQSLFGSGFRVGASRGARGAGRVEPARGRRFRGQGGRDRAPVGGIARARPGRGLRGPARGPARLRATRRSVNRTARLADRARGKPSAVAGRNEEDRVNAAGARRDDQPRPAVPQ